MNSLKIKKLLWWPLSLILLWAISAGAGAQSIPNLLLNKDLRLTKLTSLHWADASKKATAEQVKVKMFEGTLIESTIVKDRFSPPLSEANHWFAFTLTNPTSQQLKPSVYIRQAYAHKVNLHYQQQGHWVSQLNGTDIALEERLVRSLEPAFLLTLEPQQSQTFYLEMDTKIKLLPFDIIQGDAKNSHKFREMHFTLVKVFIGAGLLISLINILMYLSFKDRVYIYYSAYTLSFIAATFVINSFDLLLGWQLEDRSFLFLTYHGMIIFITLFISEILNTNQDMPRINLILKLCRWLALVIGLATLFDGNYFSYTLVAFIPVSVFFLGILIYAGLVGQSSARYLAIGVSLFLSGIICVHATNLGFLPDNALTEHAGLVGALAEMGFFSMALFKRVEMLNLDINTANARLLNMAQQAQTKLENTVIKRTQELNQAKQAAEQAYEARSDFFATINHEMRTPLNGILGMISLISQEQEKAISVQHLKTLKSASQQLSSLINNVLDHSKLNHNTSLEIQTINFNLSDLINEIEDIFLNMAHDKKISLNLWVSEELGLDRQGDYVKLKQVLVNLMGNAIKFTDAGQVELTILPDSSADELVFKVTDTGIGIVPTQLQHIFTAYHQVPGSQSYHQAGTGLGLSIAKNLATIMGGSLMVKSDLGQGSQFDLCVPLAAIVGHPKQDTQQEKAVRILDLSEKCILVADDSAINQQVVEAFLASTGISLVKVEDGEQALERFKQGGIDIVLMDLHMGLVGGIAATKAIRRFESHHQVAPCPIIIHTADTDPNSLQESTQAGANSCLYKPYTQMQLLNLLYEYFNLAFDEQSVELLKAANMSNLVPKFLQHCAQSLEHCHGHIEVANFEALGQEVHKMLGSCGLFEATAMYASLQQVESILKAQSKQEKPEDTQALLALLATVADQLHEYRQAAKP